MSLLVIIPLALLAAVLVRIVGRGLQMRRLVRDGVATTGRVVAKAGFSSNGRSRVLRYEYTDAAGNTHVQRSLVPAKIWDAAREGSPIHVVYSASRPFVSAPKYLVDSARAALAARS